MEVLDGLVGIGFVARSGLAGVESLGLGHFGDRVAEAADHLCWLRSVGDEEQALDLASAIDAAWATRSTDPGRRRQAVAFRASEAGYRHRARLLSRTMGQPFAEADGAAEGGGSDEADGGWRDYLAGT